MQIGCNNGREVLSAAALGARTAFDIDQSEAFLAQAAQLNAVAGTDCRFLRADIYDLPPDAPRPFDIALVTIGVLGWMPDLPGFFRAAAGLRVEQLEEFPHSNREAEYDRYQARPAQLPLCCTLVARKPAP